MSRSKEEALGNLKVDGTRGAPDYVVPRLIYRRSEGVSIGTTTAGVVAGATEVTPEGGDLFPKCVTAALFRLAGLLFAGRFSIACSATATGFGSKSGGGKELSLSRSVD
jgi:hypothetical protein